MKTFCADLKDQAMIIINIEKREMTPLTDEEKESYENQEICHICEKEFCTDENDKELKKKCKKSEIIVVTQGNTEEPLIVFVIYDTEYLKSFLLYFIMDLHMIITS